MLKHPIKRWLDFILLIPILLIPILLNQVHAGDKKIFVGDTVFSGSMGGSDSITLSISSGLLHFKGKWDGGHSTAKSLWTLGPNGSIYIDKEAEINNNMKDKINARQLSVFGQGPQSTLETDPNFDADHMGYNPTDTNNWVSNGWSVLYLKNLTYITHASKNLPTVNKRSGSPPYDLTHHGLLIFQGGSKTVWKVSDTDQSYDGGINWDHPLDVIVDKSLTFTGVYVDAAKVHFGSLTSGGSTLIKKGKGTLHISGSQGYASEAKIVVAQGTVIFNTDPGKPNEDQLNKPYKLQSPGQHLSLEVSSEGEAQLLANEPVWDAHNKLFLPQTKRNGFYTIESQGVMKVGAGQIDISTTLTLSSSSILILSNITDSSYWTAEGKIQLAGNIKIEGGSLGLGKHILMKSSAGISGTFSSVQIPDGVILGYDEKSLFVTVSKPLTLRMFKTKRNNLQEVYWGSLLMGNKFRLDGKGL